MAKKVDEVNQFGDHACPHCGAMFIDPLDCDLKAGTAKCKVCGKEYCVPEKIAELANKNKRRYDKACGKVIKELSKK